MKYFIFIYLFFLYWQPSNGQCTLEETVKTQLIKDWELAKVMTNQYLNVMPADKYSFKVRDSIRTFAQQMLHLAQVNGAMIFHGAGVPRPNPLLRKPGAKSGCTVQGFSSLLYKCQL